MRLTKKKGALKPYTTPVWLQVMVVISAICTFALIIFYMVLSFGYGAYQDDLRSLVYMLPQFTPAIVFISAYALNPKKLTRQHKVFESVLIAIAVYGIMQALQLALMFAAQRFTTDDQDLLQNIYNYYSYAVIAVIIVGLTYLRVSKRWK